MSYSQIIGNSRTVLNIPYSKIGFAYPNIFIEENENSYLNFDVFLATAFPMSQKDFYDWYFDSEELSEEKFKEQLEENGINPEQFYKAIKGEE